MLTIQYTVDNKQYDIELQESQRVFNNYRKAVIRAARSNLKKEGKIASGRLYKNIRLSITASEHIVNIQPFMKGADYWQYVDQGVQGAKSNVLAPDSPFKFGSGTGPKGKLVPAIDKWTIVKPIKEVRDERGRFIPRKRLVRMIARSVYLKGLRPTYFISDPFEKLIDRYLDKLGEAFAEDVNRDLMIPLLGEPIKLQLSI